MKIGLMFVNSGPFSEPELFTHLLQTAERCGIESAWTVEHVVIPQDYKSPYPYSTSGKIPGGEEVPIPDPLVPLAYAAAITSKLMLGTGVVILPQRHPIYVAKELATLDLLSKGRIIFGIGSGWLKEEFDSLGIDFHSRGTRTDESIQVIRSLWTQNPSEFRGKHFNFGPVKSFPKPKYGVPILIGGHSRAAARRAARFGDGFFPAIRDPEKLREVLAMFREECRKIGRNSDELELSSLGNASLDQLRQMKDLGLARVVVPPPAFDAAGITHGLEKIASDLLPRL